MILLENVSKVFTIPHERKRTLYHWLSSFGGRRYDFEALYALRDVSLHVREGEFLGVIGKNGSGKSSLLKVISRIYRPTSGRVSVRGELFPMLDLGVGFQPEFSCKDNVYLYGTILGFSRKEITRRLDGIIAFAELERFVDAKLATLSMGMMLRLAFAIAIQSQASIFLVDEVLAVGDNDFWVKCEEQFREFKKQGRTVLFVSHDMSSVKAFCNRVLVMGSGKIVNEGSADEMVESYLNA